jgi:class 3 adenylate cyclase
MARKRNRTRLRSFAMFLAFVALGLAGGAFFMPLSQSLQHDIAVYYPQLRPDVAQALEAAQPLLSQVIVGLGVFGLGAFLLASVYLSGYARGLLAALVERLREKDLLPYHFEANKKRRKLLDAQEGVFDLFDSYVEQLHGAHTEKERYQQALNSYTDPNVMARMHKADSQGAIKSERRPVAVLFADIRGFTAMSEALQPEQVVGLLNDYFAFSAAAVGKNGGTVNKFIGDAVMALFEQPPAYKQDASAPRSAILAAIEMQEEFQRFLPVWKSRIPQTFDCNLGVGVHFGDAILGTVGSEERREYTAIGDTVNFASRLCSAAKPGQVRVSEDCFERVQELFEGQAQEAMAMKGKAGTHVTYVVSRKRTMGR